jgi:tRNA (guanine-N7-)-methyltransferase
VKKRKLARFAELETFSNVVQPKLDEIIHDNYPLKGKWSSEYFKNQNPLILELGCGKGEYTIGLAEKYPHINFIGIDIKGDRLWKGGKTSIEKGLKNVAFIRLPIENISFVFGENEVSEIWITFPDPQPNKPKTKKRLTSPAFLDRYTQIIKPKGIIHLKTDNAGLFEYTVEVLKERNHSVLFITRDLHSSKMNDDILSIRTYYETIYLKKEIPICYLNFTL